MRGRKHIRRPEHAISLTLREHRRARRCALAVRPIHLFLLALTSFFALLVGWNSHGDSTLSQALHPLLRLRLPPPSPRGISSFEDVKAPQSTLPAINALVSTCGEELGFETFKGSGCLPRRMLFIGGLQRSGTSTLAALIQKLPHVYGLEFNASRPEDMEAAPWKKVFDVRTGTWMKWAYFKEVVATGGAEGKLLQSVFPYRYLIWDAKFTPIAVPS